MLYSPSPPSYPTLFYVVVGYKLFSSQSYLPPLPLPLPLHHWLTEEAPGEGGGGREGEESLPY